MTIKLVGSVLILLGCGYCGYRVGQNHRDTVRWLRQIVALTEYMERELQCKLTPIPELFIQAADACKEPMGHICLAVGRTLETRSCKSVSACMQTVLTHNCISSGQAEQLLVQLGDVLGSFDLNGQLEGIRSVHNMAVAYLTAQTQDLEVRLRYYQTLGLCAGAAIVILFI